MLFRGAVRLDRGKGKANIGMAGEAVKQFFLSTSQII